MTNENKLKIVQLEKLKQRAILRAKVISNCINVRQIEEKYPRMLVPGTTRKYCPHYNLSEDPVFNALVESRSCYIEINGLFGKKKFYSYYAADESGRWTDRMIRHNLMPPQEVYEAVYSRLDDRNSLAVYLHERGRESWKKNCETAHRPYEESQWNDKRQFEKHVAKIREKEKK
ncbi:hypothetical protein J4402_05625 [Candidatus Pacearchaeota archaeon]|nr:hypothetical protein [Candidatus Pacearchaeota archaeon]